MRSLILRTCCVLSVISCAAAVKPDQPEGSPLPASDKPAHVYLLIGQSNMAGRAPYGPEHTGVIPSCYLLNGQDEWEPARNPLNRYSTVHRGLERQRLGPGYAFALAMHEHDPATQIGLIVNARGGASIRHWEPGARCYDEAVRRTHAALRHSGTLKGILWHHGEGNRNDPDYLQKMIRLVENLRAEFDIPDLPFIAAQIKVGGLVNPQIATLPEHVPFTATVSSEGLTTFDKSHFDLPSIQHIGRRYAAKMIALQEERHQRAGPEARTWLTHISNRATVD